MSRRLPRGKVQTVLGLIAGDQLGFTITHEHLLSDFRILLPNGTPVHLSEDVNKSDVGAGIRDAILFKEVGGGSIVDVTPLHAGRNPKGLARIARESGVNVVMGTAHYIAPTHTPDMDMDNKSVDDIARLYVDEITGGVGGTDVKPRIIGEIGCSWPLAANERKCLQAAALAQQEREKGLSEPHVRAITVDNPARALSIS